jgi:hypothetical protein
MTEKKLRRAPRGNQNARMQGFYGQVLDEAREVEGIDEEIAILRVKLLALISNHPDRIDLQMAAANTITRMVRTRHSLSANQKKSLKEAMTKVLTEIAVPLGIKAFIQP